MIKHSAFLFSFFLQDEVAEWRTSTFIINRQDVNQLPIVEVVFHSEHKKRRSEHSNYRVEIGNVCFHH